MHNPASVLRYSTDKIVGGSNTLSKTVKARGRKLQPGNMNVNKGCFKTFKKAISFENIL